MSFLHRLFKFRIFKFRATLAEELEDLHTESLHLQQALTQSRLLQRTWTKWFAIYAILAYLALNVAYYTLFLSHDYMIRTYAVMTSVAVAALLYGIHWLIRWYFRTTIHIKEDRLASFRDRKQELIEEVKNKETYAVAKTILEKYGETVAPDVRPTSTVSDNANKDPHQRVSVKPTPPGSNKPAVSVTPNNIGTLQTTSSPMPVHAGPNRLAMNATPGKLPRTILPPQRTFWGAILDVIVGDGPSKRYALICKSCNSHNGMALEEEYEYLSFRCAYCNYFNSSRKQKPVFQGDIVAHDPPSTTTNQPQNESTVERMETSSSESSDSNKDNETRITRRSIRVPASTNSGESRSRSISGENHREHHPNLSSSEESLSKKD
jgi:hypothetical protein